ncbi:MAG: class A beta-lactamase-related serine hydrolase, partial [Clostridia bacterium]|nr:class A beta-lactamase-related serine hydrolase [Clostridia bacterium]
MINEFSRFEGDVGLFVCPVDGGEPMTFNADRPLMAASVIKLAVMVAAFDDIRAGRLDGDALVTIRNADKYPSCGALTYLHEGLQVTIRDLIVLMIILSDNSATNLLIDRVGIERINACAEKLGLKGFTVRRRLFDAEASARGLENTVTAEGCGELLMRLYHNDVLGAPWDKEMLDILFDQRLNGKIPFFLHGVKIAHKTGEDDGITNDVGLIMAKRPFVCCFLGNNVDVPA